jgi:hypothetical protein
VKIGYRLDDGISERSVDSRAEASSPARSNSEGTVLAGSVERRDKKG